MQRLLVIATAALSITASAVAAPAKAPAPYGAVRACLVRHGFAISHEAHGPRIGWGFNASAAWKVAGKGRGSDDAMVVVGGSIARAKSYEARLRRLLGAVYTGEGSDKVSNYLHRTRNVVYAWMFFPESSVNQRNLALCAHQR